MSGPGDRPCVPSRTIPRVARLGVARKTAYFAGMFRWFRKSPPVFDAPLAPESPFTVIGDVHGADALLARLLDRLEHEAPGPILCVGDYIDRGENSAAVVDLLRARQDRLGDRLICLMGNHERMALDFLNEPVRTGPRWTRYGGLQTLASYGVPPVPGTASDEDWLRTRDLFLGALGSETEGWLRALPLSWQSGNVAVVHAAADPGLPIAEQSPQTLLWGHPDFTETPRSDGTWIVHGHTIVQEPSSEHGRIATDTGAYATGRLTAARIEVGAVTFQTA